jgi:integrase/recombinase XerD
MNKGLTKQMKTLTPKIEESVLFFISQNSRNPIRDRVIFLLSIKSGLRSKEISKLKWKHILDSDGNFRDSIHLTNDCSKGKNGGRIIPLNSRLKNSLIDLLGDYQKRGKWMISLMDDFVINTQRNRTGGTSPQVITNFFHNLYRNMGLFGYGSHSGRRTFITRTSRKINEVGGSMKDIQYLSGHSSLQTTQRYIEHDPKSQMKVVELV